uniref:Uncharacterized protein n=1 Tax=Trypanosoma congolense (strain IL3000) TaxID=1068625 RepID=G0V354_TRYCI|nr:hypothetical protein, unlikely [Trypanosoma congolense IL3000]
MLMLLANPDGMRFSVFIILYMFFFRPFLFLLLFLSSVASPSLLGLTPLPIDVCLCALTATIPPSHTHTRALYSTSIYYRFTLCLLFTFLLPYKEGHQHRLPNVLKGSSAQSSLPGATGTTSLHWKNQHA